MVAEKSIAIINFKAYLEATGLEAVKLAKVCERVSREMGIEVIIAVQPSDIREIARAVSIKVFAEHIDPVEPGAHTGAILPEAVKQQGATGTLINHSEKRLSADEIAGVIRRTRELDIISVVCADTPWKANLVARMRPDYIAIEPPELIGGNVSVSVAEPEVISNTIKNVHRAAQIPVLCGAGIKTKTDVSVAIKLGVSGILVASGVTLAENPEEALRSLLSGMKYM